MNTLRHIIAYAYWVPINENTKLAKQYVVSVISKRLRSIGSGAQISSEELEKKALSSPEVKQIFDLTKGHPGYTLAFLRFYFEQKINITQPAGVDEVRSLDRLMSIIKDKKHIISQLDHNIDYYASQKSEEGTVTGFEAIADEIRTLERAKDAKWFIDGLPKPLRDQYRALSTSEQATVITLAVQLKEIGTTAINRLFEKIKAFTSWTIKDVIDYTSNYVKGYSNLGMSKKIVELEELEPEAGIIYSDDQYLVLSVRTENSQKKLCAIANWCINRGSFTSYAKDGVQLNIFNFGIEPSDPLFLTGTTIYYTGKVYTSHDINDKLIKKSDDPAKHLTDLGYPEKLVSTVIGEFQNEVGIKKTIVDLKIDASTPVALLFSILKNSYLVDLQNNLKIMEVVLSNIRGRIKSGMSRKQVVTFYTQYGVLSKFSAQVLKELLGDLTETELQSILTSTIQKFKMVHRASSSVAKLPPQIKNVIAQEKDILRELGYVDTK